MFNDHTYDLCLFNDHTYDLCLFNDHTYDLCFFNDHTYDLCLFNDHTYDLCLFNDHTYDLCLFNDHTYDLCLFNDHTYDLCLFNDHTYDLCLFNDHTYDLCLFNDHTYDLCLHCRYLRNVVLNEANNVATQFDSNGLVKRYKLFILNVIGNPETKSREGTSFTSPFTGVDRKNHVSRKTQFYSKFAKFRSFSPTKNSFHEFGDNNRRKGLFAESPKIKSKGVQHTKWRRFAKQTNLSTDLNASEHGILSKDNITQISSYNYWSKLNNYYFRAAKNDLSMLNNFENSSTYTFNKTDHNTNSFSDISPMTSSSSTIKSIPYVIEKLPCIPQDKHDRIFIDNYMKKGMSYSHAATKKKTSKDIPVNDIYKFNEDCVKTKLSKECDNKR